jgi:uncharacterized protein YcbK (DUF882 family)
LAASFGAAAGLGSLGRIANAATTATPATHRLSLYHIHTAEKITIVYREHGTLIPGALDELNYFLRDFRTEQIHEIDVGLLDAVHEVYTAFERRGHFEVISGYRSPRTNAALRHVTTGVAEHSLHIEGRALDVRLTSAKTTAVRDSAIALARGGVGYYPESNFVHIDTGPVRTW